LKKRICDEFNQDKGKTPLEEANIRLRNPKLEHDIGEVIHDCDILENLHLYDEKEMYV